MDPTVPASATTPDRPGGVVHHDPCPANRDLDRTGDWGRARESEMEMEIHADQNRQATR